MTKRNVHSAGARLVRHAALAVVLLMPTIQAASAGSQPAMDPGMEMPNDAPPAQFPFGAPGTPDAVDRVVNIAMGEMNFDPISIDVAEGETIRFVVTNKSEVDHDFTLGDLAKQAEHRAEMASMMQAGEMKHGDDPNAILVAAGQRGELTWKFTQAGSLEFDCNIPGHYEAGMKGAIIVRKATAGDPSTDTP